MDFRLFFGSFADATLLACIARLVCLPML